LPISSPNSQYKKQDANPGKQESLLLPTSQKYGQSSNGNLKRTKKDLPISFLLNIFASIIKKKQLTMIRLSWNMLNFVPSVKKDWQHRGELLSFDPSENLQNSTCMGEKSESCFSCSCIYAAHSFKNIEKPLSFWFSLCFFAPELAGIGKK
jgi:hypothetical protein